MNVNILIIFCGILWMQSCVDAQSTDCRYGDYYFRNIGYGLWTSSYYTCILRANNKNSINKVTTISGQHKARHTDDHVRYFKIKNGTTINIFTSVFCEKFKNLEVIDSDGAALKSIDGNSLQKCENLDILILKGTQLNSIPNELLARNRKLLHILIADSQVTTLPENLFSSQNKLNFLSLSGNQIRFLPSNIFSSLIDLEHLDVRNNKLQSIDSKWFQNLGNLNELDISDNQIAEVPDKCFELLTNLEKLRLHNNKIKLLHSNSFVGLHNLNGLDLDGNEIAEFPHNTFKPLTNLEWLSMYGNKLTVIDAASFGVHKNLKLIYLQNNKINKIDEKFIDNTAVNGIDIRGNMCSNEELRGIESIKAALKICFENYKATKPKTQQLLTSHVKVTRTQQCGQSVNGGGNIIGGKHVTRGDFPWVAVLSTSSGDYFCGGTLVTSRKVVTAGHCIHDKHAKKPTLAGEIIVQLGAYDLDRKIEVGRFPYAVQSINVHPDWNTLTQAYDADIAVLVLDSEVTFSGYIQPICLVQALTATSASTGVVVGYGKSEDVTKKHENIPKILEMPIHSNEDCFLKNYLLATLSSKRTFCGGTGAGVGVCSGDSGSGLFVTNGTTYYLRGIVSSSLRGGPYGCDVDTYAVFTDVTKYIDWINNVSTNRFE
ncbi:uncharacterized protein [Chironomus tepperi]|uniref:uncharacterized protein n=1 Tax=Chironomus tepperi TaxID=113505 RepID=UPI00391FB561